MPGHFLQCDAPGCEAGISSPDDKFGGRALELGRAAGWHVAEANPINLNRGPDFCPEHRYLASTIPPRRTVPSFGYFARRALRGLEKGSK